jgi:hypothetical protein
LEEGGNRPTSSYSSNEIAEQENERGVGVLQDRVSVLKMVNFLTSFNAEEILLSELLSFNCLLL